MQQKNLSHMTRPRCFSWQIAEVYFSSVQHVAVEQHAFAFSELAPSVFEQSQFPSQSQALQSQISQSQFSQSQILQSQAWQSQLDPQQHFPLSQSQSQTIHWQSQQQQAFSPDPTFAKPANASTNDAEIRALNFNKDISSPFNLKLEQNDVCNSAAFSSTKLKE